MFKDLFQKKRKYATIPSERTKRDIPEGLANKCKKCGTIQLSKELEKNLMVCSACGYHFRITALERVQLTMDDGRLFEFDSELIPGDPLEFPDYPDKIAAQAEKTGLRDAVITGEGTVGGYPVVVAFMAFEFFAGSMGSVVGEKIVRAAERAMQKKYPLLIFSTSGGARMQESILSLMQMAKTSAVIGKFQEQGGLYISVLTDPTYGGVTASFAMLGDINIAEPGALIGFAGPIVIEQTIRQKLPENFQTAEFNLKHGQIDMVVHRKEMRMTITKLLDMHQVKGEGTYGG